MKIAIVSGSHRQDSQSERVARYIQGEFALRGMKGEIISLAKNPLPLWDEEVWGKGNKWSQLWSPISHQLIECAGLVIVSPEWSGMVPPGLKNFLLLCTPKEVGHKPALIVTVSSGIGGSYPVAELRSSSYKNNRIVYVPEHVIVRDVEKMLNGEEPTNDRDAQIRERLRYAVNILIEYARALDAVRESGVVNHKDFPHGM